MRARPPPPYAPTHALPAPPSRGAAHPNSRREGANERAAAVERIDAQNLLVEFRDATLAAKDTNELVDPANALLKTVGRRAPPQGSHARGAAHRSKILREARLAGLRTPKTVRDPRISGTQSLPRAQDSARAPEDDAFALAAHAEACDEYGNREGLPRAPSGMV